MLSSSMSAVGRSATKADVEQSYASDTFEDVSMSGSNSKSSSASKSSTKTALEIKLLRKVKLMKTNLNLYLRVISRCKSLLRKLESVKEAVQLSNLPKCKDFLA
jgi:hypothetical protein